MSSFGIKIIAVIATLIDHIGFVFFPSVEILRIIGRIAMPLFAFQVALGFRHTKNRNKYILRMLVFAIISQLPFMLLMSIHSNIFKLNIGFTFLFALLILYSVEEIKPFWEKIICLVPILFLAWWFNYDYYLYGVALIIIFYFTNTKKIFTFPLWVIASSVYSLYKDNYRHIYSLFAFIPVLLYNGKKGKNIKYFFYAFYPLHMLLLYLIFKFYV